PDVAGLEPTLDQFFEAGLEDRDVAAAQPLDLLGDDVGARDLVADVRQVRPGGETDVPGPDDRDAAHALSSLTSASSGSRWSARAGNPLRRRAALSSTELAGRVAARAGSPPARRNTSAASPYHVVGPPLVTWNTPGARVAASRRMAAARSAVNVG